VRGKVQLFLLKCLGLGLLAVTSSFASSVFVTFTASPFNPLDAGWSIATVNNMTGQLLLCDDAAHQTAMPSTEYNYDYSVLSSDLPNVSNLRFGSGAYLDPNATRDYEVAAYLMWEYAGAGYNSANPHPGPTAAQNQAATDYNDAIWNLFDPHFTPTANAAAYQANAIAFVTANSNTTGANGQFLSSLYQRTAIFTPTPLAVKGIAAGSSAEQEFMELLPIATPSPSPEPAVTWIVAGAMGMCMLVRRYRTAQTSRRN
jgi:hypothetical protein